jgi:hypothetical protein
VADAFALMCCQVCGEGDPAQPHFHATSHSVSSVCPAFRSRTRRSRIANESSRDFGNEHRHESDVRASIRRASRKTRIEAYDSAAWKSSASPPVTHSD